MLERERNFEDGEVVELTIERLTDRGLGHATKEAIVGPQREHKVYDFFVRKALPGDRVLVEIDYARRTRCTGHFVELLEPSRLRQIEPRCPHFGRRETPNKGCGGCTYQNLRYRHQLMIKERQIKACLQEEHLDPGLVFPAKAMEEPWFYRNKMEFSFGDTAEGEPALGFHPTGYRHDLINLESCYLQSRFSSDFMPQVRQWCFETGINPYTNRDRDGWLRNLMVRESHHREERMVELVTTDKDEVVIDGEAFDPETMAHKFAQAAHRIADELGEAITSLYWTQKRVEKGHPTTFDETLLDGKDHLVEELHLPGQRKLHFQIHPRAFFQPNTRGAEVLMAEVIAQAGLDEASDKGAMKVVDLYCGTGTIGLCLAPFVDRVIGVELQPDAVANARKNAAANDLDNLTFYQGHVSDVLAQPEARRDVESADLLVVDPPRGGLLPPAIDEVLRIGAPTLIYVSCKPSSLAKNLVDLADGGYHIEVIQPVDQFPQTFHVECVAVLRRASHRG